MHEGIDRFHQIFTDQDRCVLLGYVFQSGFDTVFTVEPHHILDPLDRKGRARCNFRGKLPGLLIKRGLIAAEPRNEVHSERFFCGKITAC